MTMIGRSDAIAYLVRPGIAMYLDRAWHELWPYRPLPEWAVDLDFTTGDLLFRSAFGGMTLADEFEIHDQSYKHRMLPRFKHWLSKHMPRPHHRYVANPAIRRPRHPSTEQ